MINNKAFIAERNKNMKKTALTLAALLAVAPVAFAQTPAAPAAAPVVKAAEPAKAAASAVKADAKAAPAKKAPKKVKG